MSVFDDQGWGYCRFCIRLVEMGDGRRLNNHRHALNKELCPGSCSKPSALPENPDQTMDKYHVPVDLSKEGY